MPAWRQAGGPRRELVVLVKSLASEARLRDMLKSVDAVLRTHKEVGEYNQTIQIVPTRIAEAWRFR
jgi:phosphomannomutase/phosphoglucomutase